MFLIKIAIHYRMIVNKQVTVPVIGLCISLILP